MTEPERILKRAGDDPAAELLRSALSDRAPEGAKARALAALGLASPDTAPMQSEREDAESGAILVFPTKRSPRASKKEAQEARPLFQSVLEGHSRPSAVGQRGRTGINVALALQAAAIILFLLSSPTAPLGPSSRAPTSSTAGGIDIDMMAGPARSPKATPKAEAQAEGEPRSPAKAITHAKAPIAPAEEPQIAVSEIVAGAEEPKAEAMAPAEPPASLAHGQTPTSQITIPIETITRPKRIGGREPQYTRAAREARVEGTAIVQCEITTNGSTRDCKVLKSLPHMEEELLAAAQTWRFSPATAEGRPISMRTSFTITLVLPKN